MYMYTVYVHVHGVYIHNMYTRVNVHVLWRRTYAYMYMYMLYIHVHVDVYKLAFIDVHASA